MRIIPAVSQPGTCELFLKNGFVYAASGATLQYIETQGNTVSSCTEAHLLCLLVSVTGSFCLKVGQCVCYTVYIFAVFALNNKNIYICA